MPPKKVTSGAADEIRLRAWGLSLRAPGHGLQNRLEAAQRRDLRPHHRPRHGSRSIVLFAHSYDKLAW